MKKINITRFLNIFCTIIAFIALCFCAFDRAYADTEKDKTEILQTFDKYVQDANSYSNNLPNYYMENAKIIRVVNKKQGGQKEVLIPFDRYLKELSSHSTLARTVKYKNRYVNRKLIKLQNGYKLSATRIPRNDKSGLPCYFVFVKTDNANGSWKIQEESMTTNVQTFLSAK